MPRSVFLGCILGSTVAAVLLIPQSLRAEPAPLIARAVAGGGLPELAVGFDRDGTLKAAVCRRAGCPLSGGVDLGLPRELGAERDHATLTVVPIGQQRHAIVVDVPTGSPGVEWKALVVAPPGSAAPKILFRGSTGYVQGEHGLRQGPVLEISGPVDEKNVRRVVLGELHEDLTLCGREAILVPRMLDPRSLTLRPAKVQRIPAEQRASAPQLIAKRVEGESPASGGSADATSTAGPADGGSLLRAVGASSAIGWPRSLTDGDPETTWSEHRGGAGRGEFVLFRAPDDVPLVGFDLVLRPAKRNVEHGVGAKTLWLVTTGQVYQVRFDEDPWKFPGQHWRVTLPAPLRTDCVAVVTDSAYHEAPDSAVTLAEVTARSEFANASVDQLLDALARADARARAAASVIGSLGPAAYRALSERFARLSPEARALALQVMDGAPCELSAPVYVDALLGPSENDRAHGADHLRRCGSAAVAALVTRAPRVRGARLARIGDVLARSSPAEAIRLLGPRLLGTPEERRQLRDVIARAARSPAAQPAIQEQLERTDLRTEAAVELLRALGKDVAHHAVAAARLVDRVLSANADWRRRYLLISAIQALAGRDPRMRARLQLEMTRDPSPYVRAEATRSVRDPAAFKPELLRSLSDSEVRVREAAAQTLAGPSADFALDALATRLHDDSWPVVRAAAAQALGTLGPGVAADGPLEAALDDDSALVRAGVIEGLSARHAVGAADSILDRFEDRKEDPNVRRAAARALGNLCYEPAVDALTDRARTLTDPMLSSAERGIAGSALAALARIHPPDLQERLAPLLSSKDANRATRQSAEAALREAPGCGARQSAPSRDR